MAGVRNRKTCRKACRGVCLNLKLRADADINTGLEQKFQHSEVQRTIAFIAYYSRMATQTDFVNSIITTLAAILENSMSINAFMHRHIACRAVPELAELDPRRSNFLLNAAVKAIPFKDKRALYVALLWAVIFIPVFNPFSEIQFFAEALQTSTSTMSIVQYAIGFCAIPLVWMQTLRIARPEILALLKTPDSF